MKENQKKTDPTTSTAGIKKKGKGNMTSKVGKAKNTEAVVITPGGPRSIQLTHFVAPNEAVRRTSDGRLLVVPKAQSGAKSERLTVEEDLVLTPGGYRPRSKVHHVEPGQTLHMHKGRLRRLDSKGTVLADLGQVEARPGGLPLMPRHASRLARRFPAYGSGWIVYADWSNLTGQPISSFSTTWLVPPAPSTTSGQTIFLFNGIQNSTMIYQPVLQWGPSAAGGGNYWSVASWYADGQNGLALYSSLVRVNEGDSLVGLMTLSGQSAAGSSYNCDFSGIANTSLAIQDVQELTWCIRNA